MVVEEANATLANRLEAVERGYGAVMVELREGDSFADGWWTSEKEFHLEESEFDMIDASAKTYRLELA